MFFKHKSEPFFFLEIQRKFSGMMISVKKAFTIQQSYCFVNNVFYGNILIEIDPLKGKHQHVQI
jgi:hypothetical protein